MTMAEVTGAMVKDLRDKTGAGMMDCKKALVEAGGDMEAAVDWLRKKGLAAAAKKSGRVAAEGLVGVAHEGNRAAMVEVNAETDFVARNDAFQAFVETVSKLALSVGEDVEALKATAYPGATHSVAEELTHLIATVGENMTIRRVAVIEVSSGAAASYVHGALKPGLGKIGVLVALEGKAEAALSALGRQIGMHIAATRPDAISAADVDPAAVARERAIFADQARAEGKPDAIIEKMVEGRVRKYFADVVLLEQVWVHDGESKVQKIVHNAGAEVTRFVRFTLGDGIEKETTDFAAEVAAAAGV
jgi:elongation factor Ts